MISQSSQPPPPDLAALEITPQEARLAKLYEFLYPVWKTVFLSWLISVVITIIVIWFAAPTLDARVLIMGVGIATICSISISYVVSHVAYTYQTLIRQKNDMLSIYASDLTQANQELEAFARTVAHDLKNPVAGIVGYASLLREDFADFSPAEVMDLLQRIQQQGEHTSKIVDAILMLSRTRRADVELQPIDMMQTIANVLERLSSEVSAKEAIIHYPKQWPKAVGYAPWVEEIWFNYINNALKYGGEPPKLILGAAFEGEQVRFWVDDNGAGLTQEEQARLFTEFTRLNNGAIEGHGLGLSIVQRIAHKLGGQVGVESTVGCGSRFYFTLSQRANAA
ncbi:MAG: HAMP domain-containing sensor histidine kinase [Pseudomonadota bacterium]